MGCEIRKDANNQVTFIKCGRGRPAHPACLFCTKPSTKLCDGNLKPFRLNAGAKTCDAPMCDDHALRVGIDKDLCPLCVKAAEARGMTFR